MRKITLLLAAIAISFATYAVGMSGTYKVGVTDPVSDYTTLKAAVDAINTNGVAGDILLEITSDLTEAANISLGVNTGGFTLTLKPAIGVSPTINLNGTTTANIDGNLVIGSPNASNTSLVSTNNVIIDGSNTINGTSKDLTLTGPVTSAQISVIRIFGNNDNITIKNCIITCRSTSGSSIAPINVTNFNASSVNYLPDNLTIQNNTLSSVTGNGGTVVHIANSGTPTVGNTGLVIRDNIMFGRQRGLFISYTNGGDIFGNTISEISQASQGSAAITLQTNFGTAGTFNIYSNKIVALTSLNATAGASNGVIGIDNQCVTPKVVNIYNNMISGFGVSATTINSKIYGIRTNSSSTCNIFQNTIFIPEMTDMTTFGTSYIAGIVYASTAEAGPTAGGTANIKNNIIISNESTMKVWGIRRVGTTGTFTSNNNVIYASNSNNWIGYYNNTDIADWGVWQSTSGQDSNSKSIPVNFTNAATGDLTLTGASVGDWQLATPKLASVTSDIEGAPRAALTYAGADEATTDLTTIAKQFTVTVPNGTSKVYIAGDITGKSWDITDPIELAPTGTANQFSGIYPCVDGVAYKYLCEKGDLDYYEAIYNGGSNPLNAPNRTYNAADVVPIWYRVKSVKLNVSFAEGSVVPTKLFVKGSFNGWTTPIELTKTENTFSTTLSGVLGDKIPANAEYKYYTNDESTDNWESDASGIAISNRWSIAPVMNDIVARFTTMLTTKIDDVKVSARILRTMSGVEVQLDREANIELYTMNGVLIDKVRIDGTYTRDLNSGVYIIRIDGIATKFVK